MKEIGGYLDFEQMNEKNYHNAYGFNICRNAIAFIVQYSKYKKVYIPAFYCDSIKVCFETLNISYEEYKIDKDFLPDSGLKVQHNECVVLVDYYGILTNKVIIELKRKFKNIIVDYTQAYFKKPIKGVDSVYCCRKYFGVPDGAFLYTDKDISSEYNKLKIDNSAQRYEHLIGRIDKDASSYYSTFVQVDKDFKKEPIKSMSLSTLNLLGYFSYSKIIKQRSSNYKYLSNHLEKINKLNAKKFKGLYMYPLYCEDGQKLRNYLIKNKIYVPIFWKDAINENNKDSFEYKYSMNIVPLPIDQRYNILDMKCIVNLIRKFWRLECQK